MSNAIISFTVFSCVLILLITNQYAIYLHSKDAQGLQVEEELK